MKSKIVIGLFSFISLFLGKLHAGPAYEEKADKALIKTAKIVGKQHKLSYLSMGLGNIITRDRSNTAPWGLVWTSQRKLSLEEAQVLARQVATQMLDGIQASKDCMNYRRLDYIHGAKYRKTPVLDPKKAEEEAASKTGPNDLSFRISFWDEDMERLMPPYIAEIDFVAGELFYYLADPETLVLEECAKETLVYTWGLVKK